MTKSNSQDRESEAPYQLNNLEMILLRQEAIKFETMKFAEL